MNHPKKMVYMQKIFNPSQYRSSNNIMSSLNREDFIRLMTESIYKAISPHERPVKEKHVRKLLIGTYQTESGQFFWNNLPVLRLKEHHIVCWKFCHVLHKMIRDGHKQVLTSSYERLQILLDCGNMWRHCETGYGQLISKYCTLLFNRVNFLMRNTGFPNDLKLTGEQLDQIGDHDPSVFFDLSCEIFDALDDILKLQETVFLRTETKRLNSMTSAGQCHLAPLVTCIQDSSLLYDLSVKILFKLHGSLPSGTLEGHRLRFLGQHDQLKNFYIMTSNLQYFKTLIQIPHLADRPPNFLIASDIQQHIAPQVIMISEPECDSPDQLLVNLEDDDVNDTSSVADTIDSSFYSEQQLAGQPQSLTNLDDEQQGSQNPDSTGDIIDPDKLRIQELEMVVSQMRGELDHEKARHLEAAAKLETELEVAKRDLLKVRNELSNLKYQTASAKSNYDNLLEECTRAKHDNEISQIAMKRMMKELNDFKSKKDERINTAKITAKHELEAREEDMLVAEMNETDKIIKEATRKIEEFSENSKNIESGIKLQVNEKISEVCTNLMKAVRNLIAQSRILQREVVNSENPSLSNKGDFYKRNSAWIDGLISAANVVAVAARSLVDAADRSMSNEAKFSELAAAAHEVAAATTQLVVASRVKANRSSEKLKLLENAAKQVNQCTGNVVDASRVCAELIEQQEVDKINISSLSLHQTKKLEMETQVKMLELEEALSKERVRLGLLRRQHYEQEDAQLASTCSRVK